MSKIEDAVQAKIARRAELGLGKYGVTLADAPMSMMEILQHIQDEAMDTANYCEKAMRMLGGAKADDLLPIERIPWDAYPQARWAMAMMDGCVICTDAPLQPRHNGSGRWMIGGHDHTFVEMDGAAITGPWENSLRARPVGV